MVRKFAFALLGLLAFTAGSARADEAVLDQLYGDGVHAFFSGDCAGAYMSLSTAIRDGSQDPRAFYFRALAEMRLGREPDAVADLQKGAALETADINGRFFVGRSLERIQGPTRAVLEQYREQARELAYQQEVRHNRLLGRGGPQGGAGPQLRHDTPSELVPLPATVRGGAPNGTKPAGASPATPGAEVPDPFATPAKESPEKPATKGTKNGPPPKADKDN